MTESQTFNIEEFGLLTPVQDELRSGVDATQLDEFLAYDWHRQAEAHGEVFAEPTFEWLDLEAPENYFARLSFTWEDPDTGEVHEPARWIVRSVGRVLKASE